MLLRVDFDVVDCRVLGHDHLDLHLLHRDVFTVLASVVTEQLDDRRLIVICLLPLVERVGELQSHKIVNIYKKGRKKEKKKKYHLMEHLALGQVKHGRVDRVGLVHHCLLDFTRYEGARLLIDVDLKESEYFRINIY